MPFDNAPRLGPGRGTGERAINAGAAGNARLAEAR